MWKAASFFELPDERDRAIFTTMTTTRLLTILSVCAVIFAAGLAAFGFYWPALFVLGSVVLACSILAVVNWKLS